MAREREKIRAAFIDLGTNSVRWLAAELSSEGKTTILGRGLAYPRLGEGLKEGWELKPEAVERTFKELAGVLSEFKKLGVERTVCAATHSLRVAADRKDFVKEAKKKLGLEIEVLSGRREAETIFAGVFPPSFRPDREVILADVGGGSTEIIVARPGSAPDFFSLPLGCVALKDAYLLPGRPEKDSWQKMEEAAARVFEDQGVCLPPAGKTTGLGGTFTTLAAISLRLKEYVPEKVDGHVITAGKVASIRHELERLRPEERGKTAGLSASRADIILPGIIIAQELMKRTRSDRVRINDRGLLFGLLAAAAGSFFRQQATSSGRTGSGADRRRILRRGPERPRWRESRSRGAGSGTRSR